MARNTIGILILIFTWTKYSQANDFPSLLVANATMGTYFFLNSHCMQCRCAQRLTTHFLFNSGVIIDHEYLGTSYEKTFESLKEVIERVIREDLRGAGLNVKYYSWSKINFNKGT